MIVVPNIFKAPNLFWQQISKDNQSNLINVNRQTES